MRWIRNLSLTALGTMATLSGLTGLVWMAGTIALVGRENAAAPGAWEYLMMTSFVTMLVTGFGLLVTTGPQLPDDEL